MTDKLSPDELAAIAEYYKHKTMTHAHITVERLLAHIKAQGKEIERLRK